MPLPPSGSDGGGRGRSGALLHGVSPGRGEDVGGGRKPMHRNVRGDRRPGGDRPVRTRPVLYRRLTWPAVARLAAADPVCLIPVATLEDHGHHLPIDADLRIVEEICRRAAEEAGDDIVLMPAIPHGYSPHHMDFPGPITIGWDTFTRYCTDVGLSLAHHGFRRILYLNGHGSNQNLVEMAARLVMVERPEVLAAAAFYLSSPEAFAAIEEVRDSERGGLAHACELETSIYLAIDPEAVDMSKAA